MENQIKIPTVLHTFRKEEKLCSKKIIDRLFQDGNSFLVFPVKVVFLETNLSSTFPVQAGFSVGKKIFKRAVHRNRIKRLMREAYRLNKNDLYQKLVNRQLAVFFIFIGKEMADYKTIERSMKKAMQRIIGSLPTETDQQLKTPHE
ncbi:MAG TPA: ribonuclease P protein component [Draconibacterium sp.]|nr:ribonuclease P protein component [Draconibacterium sp.]